MIVAPRLLLTMLSGAKPKTGLLPEYAGATFAYSLYDLRHDPVPVVRARRSSDNAERDFYSEELTDGTASAWGGSFLYCRYWYDQSGNGLHASQSSAGLQPGVPTTPSQWAMGDGTVGLDFPANRQMAVYHNSWNTSHWTVSMRVRRQSAGTIHVPISNMVSSGTASILFYYNSSNELRSIVTANTGTVSTLTSATYGAGALDTLSFAWDGTKTSLGDRLEIFEDGVNVSGLVSGSGADTTVPNTANPTIIGAYNSLTETSAGQFPLNGRVQSVIWWDKSYESLGFSLI